MLPIRMYVIAGLGVFSLGYCAGTCSGSSAAPPPTVPMQEPVQQPSQVFPITPSLEQRVQEPAPLKKTIQEPPLTPEPPTPVQQPLTSQQRLLRYLKRPLHHPGDPHPADIFFQRPTIIPGADDGLWNKLKFYAREKFYDIRNEARFVYKETKDYLKEKCKEAIK